MPGEVANLTPAERERREMVASICAIAGVASWAEVFIERGTSFNETTRLLFKLSQRENQC